MTEDIVKDSIEEFVKEYIQSLVDQKFEEIGFDLEKLQKEIRSTRSRVNAFVKHLKKLSGGDEENFGDKLEARLNALEVHPELREDVIRQLTTDLNDAIPALVTEQQRTAARLEGLESYAVNLVNQFNIAVPKQGMW